MKTYCSSLVIALALGSIGSHVAAAVVAAPPSARQLDQIGSAIGVGGNAGSAQNNDYSHVAPGNDVINGGSQSASLQGVAGTVLQSGNGLSNVLKRRQDDGQTGSAAGYGGNAAATQHNDFSHVAPGNKVATGGSQRASLNGVAGNVMQDYNPGLLGLLKRRQHGVDQEGGASGYAGTSHAYQDNDFSGVAPGNNVQVGGSQSSSNTGAAGSVDQWFERARLARRLISDDTPRLNPDTDGNQLGVNLGDNRAAPVVDAQQYPTSCAQGGSHCVPHYLGLEPVERPSV